MQLGFQNSIRRYHRRLQVITDLTRNIKLLSASRSQWAGPQSSTGKAPFVERLIMTVLRFTQYGHAIYMHEFLHPFGT